MNEDSNNQPDTQSFEKVGLRFDPLPDPLRYTGASFRSIEDFVPENAWKSTNKNDKSKFEVTRNFDGSQQTLQETSSGGGEAKTFAVINAKSKATSNEEFATLIPRKTEYRLKLNLKNAVGEDSPIPRDLGVKNVKITGSFNTSSVLGMLQMQTSPKDAESEEFMYYSVRDLDDVGQQITGVSFELNAPSSSEDGINIESIGISKKKKNGTFEDFTTISINDQIVDGRVYIGTVVKSDKAANASDTFENVQEGGAGVSNAFGFYQKTYACTNFEVSLNGFQVKQAVTGTNNHGVPSTCGLLVREAPVPSSSSALAGSFCLFVEPKGLDVLDGHPSSDVSFAVYTSKDGGEKNNGLDVSFNDTDELKITRENGIFKGYYNGVLIGQENGKSKVDKFNEELVRAQAKEKEKPREQVKNDGGETVDTGNLVSRLGEKKQVNFYQLGVVAFAPTPVRIGDQIFRFSSKVQFPVTSPLIVLKDRQLAVVELCNLSLFYGRYGLGRTINTFTLLPGETTTIQLTSKRSSTVTSEQTTNVFDKVDTSSKSELERSVEQESSTATEEASSDSQSVTAGASGGAFGVSFSFSASASQSSSSSRSEFARAVSGAVSNQASEYSSERSVEANTTSTQTVQGDDSTSVTRNIQNLNNNRTLNFVFRQLNQEFISVLHLVDIRLGFFGPDGNIKDTSIDGAKAFISRYVQDDKVLEVYNKFIKNVRFVDDYQKNRVDVLVRNVAPRFDRPFKTINLLKEDQEGIVKEPVSTVPETENFETDKEDTIALNPKLGEENKISIAPDLEPIKDIPGVIISEDRYILRTEGIATNAIIGEGDALDKYGLNLEKEDIKEKRANTRIVEAKGDLLLLQKEIMNATDNEGVRIKYLKYFNFLQDGNERSSIVTRSDFDSLFLIWLNKVWTFPAFRATVLCFLSLIFSYLWYMLVLRKL